MITLRDREFPDDAETELYRREFGPLVVEVSERGAVRGGNEMSWVEFYQSHVEEPDEHPPRPSYVKACLELPLAVSTILYCPTGI